MPAPPPRSGPDEGKPRVAFRERASLLIDALVRYRKWVVLGLLSLALTDCIELLRPIVIRAVVDNLHGQLKLGTADLKPIAGWALAFFGITIVQSIGRYGWRIYLIRTSMLAGRDLRERFGRKLFGLPASFYDRSRVGELMSLATQDVESVRQALGPGLLTFADAMVYLCTVPVAMLLLSPKLTLIALVPMPFIFWFVFKNEKKFHDRYEETQESAAVLSAAASENLGGIRVVKAFARENAQIDRFRKLGQDHIAVSMRLARIESIFGPVLDLFMTASLVALVAWGGVSVIEGSLSLGTFVAFRFYLQQMVWPMTALGFSIANYQRAIASSGRLKSVFNEPNEVPEPESPQLPKGAVPGGPWKTEGRVEFRDLRFRFKEDGPWVVDGVSLTVEPGERVAFVGAIGSGKSALLSLVPRVYPAPRGSIFIDGIAVEDWPKRELRDQVGYVGQDVFLFSETVTENVAFAHRSYEALAPLGPDVIERATASASVHEEILRFEQGYSTRLGERGVNLSGGQKQRLTLARALAKSPSILILDDALSAVDVQTEERILRGLRSRAGRNTELIAAHRISTVKEADRIVVLESGRIVQTGRHAELIRQRGLYAEFYEQQRLKEDLENYVERLDS